MSARRASDPHPGDASKGEDDGSVQQSTGPDLRLLVPAVAAWTVCAATLGAATTTILTFALGTAVITCGATVLARRGPTSPVVAVVALTGVVTLVVLLSLAGHRGARTAGPVTELAGESAVVAVEGSVRTDPRLLPATDERPAPLAVMTLEVRQVSARGRTTPVRTPVLVLGDESLMSLRWADGVRLRGKLAPAEPGDDVEALLRLRGTPRRTDEAGVGFAVAEHARTRLRTAVDPLPDAARGLVPAMVIGDRSLTPEHVTDAMLATGLTHLSAVSGSNVTLVLLGVMFVVRLIGLPRRARPFVGLVAVAAFVVLARPDPSVVRAAAMGAVGLLGVSASRRAAGAPALACAVVVLLVIDPWLSRSFGFALSVLATAGLLLFARPWGEALATALPPCARPLAFAVAIPVAAQVTCGPVIVLLQSGVPLIGIPANMLAAPLVAPVTLAGLACAVVALVSVPAASLFAWVAGVPALLIALIAETLSRTPGGTVPWPDGPGGAVLLGVLTVLALVVWPAASRRWGVRAPAGAVVVALVLWFVAHVPVPWGPRSTEGWEFAGCDVGQGDALLIATEKPGHGVLVDTGRDPVLVDRCLRALGIEVLDVLVLTHYDADHVDGLQGAVRGRRVRSIVVGGAAGEAGEPPAEVRKLAGDHGVAITPVRAGDLVQWPGGRARVLNPSGVTSRSPNDASVVLDVETATLRVLLLGDVEDDASARVLRAVEGAPSPRPIDVLKVAHHGSANVTAGLYTALRPRLAVISVGADNDYGHPADRVLRELAASGSAVWRTDRDGTVLAGVTPRREPSTGPEAAPGLWVRGVATRAIR